MSQEKRIAAAARALCDLSSDACGVNRDDNWKVYSEGYKVDARLALEAADAAEPVATVSPELCAEIGKLTYYKHCMSYNGSYFTEPAGLLKRVTYQLERLLGTAPAAPAVTVSPVPEGQMHRALRHLLSEYIATRARIDGKRHDADMSEYENIVCVEAARKALAAPDLPIARQAQPTDRDSLLEEAAVEAEHWQWMNKPGHRDAESIAAAIRALKGKSGSEGAAS